MKGTWEESFYEVFVVSLGVGSSVLFTRLSVYFPFRRRLLSHRLDLWFYSVTQGPPIVVPTRYLIIKGNVTKRLSRQPFKFPLNLCPVCFVLFLSFLSVNN